MPSGFINFTEKTLLKRSYESDKRHELALRQGFKITKFSNLEGAQRAKKPRVNSAYFKNVQVREAIKCFIVESMKRKLPQYKDAFFFSIFFEGNIKEDYKCIAYYSRHNRLYWRVIPVYDDIRVDANDVSDFEL